MMLMNRFEIEKLCERISELVGDQELGSGLSLKRGKVTIRVASGKQAEQEEAFMKAVGKYLLATRHHGGDPAEAKKKFDKALSDYLESIEL